MIIKIASLIGRAHLSKASRAGGAIRSSIRSVRSSSCCRPYMTLITRCLFLMNCREIPNRRLASDDVQLIASHCYVRASNQTRLAEMSSQIYLDTKKRERERETKKLRASSWLGIREQRHPSHHSHGPIMKVYGRERERFHLGLWRGRGDFTCCISAGRRPI